MTQRKKAPPPVVTKVEYEAATPAERCVMLAREVLSLMDARFVRGDSHYSDVETLDVPLADFLDRPKCEVCARGALVIALARVANECAARGWKTPEDLGKAASWCRPRDAFPEESVWEEIEIAFEGYNNDEDYPAATAWGKKHEHLPANARLRAVCQALIANNGTVVPVVASLATESETT